MATRRPLLAALAALLLALLVVGALDGAATLFETGLGTLLVAVILPVALAALLWMARGGDGGDTDG